MNLYEFEEEIWCDACYERMDARYTEQIKKCDDALQCIRERGYFIDREDPEREKEDFERRRRLLIGDMLAVCAPKAKLLDELDDWIARCLPAMDAMDADIEYQRLERIHRREAIQQEERRRQENQGSSA